MLNSYLFFIIFVTFISIESSNTSNPSTECEKLDNKTVKLKLIPLNIAAISLKTMDFTVDFNVVTSWANPDFNESLLLSTLTQKLKKIKNRYLDETWPPELRFGNCKDCNDILIGNTPLYYNHQYHRFVVIPRFTLKFICKFDMLNYPFDTQICNITIFFMPDGRHIVYGLKLHDPQLKNLNTPPDYYLLNISTYIFNTVINNLTIEAVTYKFHLKHMVQRDISIVYIPSFLIVVISWISFWLDVSAVGPRVSLGLTSSLTLITHFNSAQKNLPSVSILTALDVWMLVCIMTVFVSMMEYAIVYNKWHKLNKKVKSTTKIKSIPNSEKECLTLCKKIFCRISDPTCLDEMCQIVFPLFFALFILFYCVYYCIL